MAHVPDGPTVRLRATEIGIVSALLLLALILRLFVGAAMPVIETDGVQYVRIAKQFRATGIPWDPLFHPLFPMAIALAAPLVGNLEAASRLVSAIFGMGLMLPAYALSRMILGPVPAMLTAGLLAIHPALVQSGASVLAESTYMFWLVLAVWISYRAVRREYTWSLPVAGVALGLAYLARPEAFLYLLGLVSIGACHAVRTSQIRRFLAPLTCAVVGFVACAGPYWTYLHQTLGRWTLSGKVLHNLVQDTGNLAAPGQTEMGYVVNHVALIAWRIAENAVLLEKYVIPEIFPGLLVLFLIPGIIFTVRRTGWWQQEGLLVLASMPPLATLAFHVEARVFIPTLPFLLPLVAAGIIAVARWARGNERDVFWLPATSAVIVLATLPFALRPLLRPDPNLTVYRQVAAWIRVSQKEDAVIMDRKPFVAFYADRAFAPMPDTSPEELSRAAQRAGASLVVLDSGNLGDRPRLVPLLYQAPPDGLRLLKDFDCGVNARLRVLEIHRRE